MLVMSDTGLGLVETGEVLPLRDDPDLKWDQEAFAAGVDRDYGKAEAAGSEPDSWEDDEAANHQEMAGAAG
jgi:hypothetical protein